MPPCLIVRPLPAAAGLGLMAAALACSSEHAPDGTTAIEPPAAEHSPEAECGSCHPQHVEEWRMSPHAYAVVDPVFHAMVRLGQRSTEGELGQFCVQCHSPLAVESGQSEVRFDAATGVWTQNTQDLDPRAAAGVSCEVCHSITDVNTPANADFVREADGVRRGTLQSPPSDAPHPTEYSPLYKSSLYCGSCHQVINPRGIAVERTYMEWVQSRFNGQRSCQDCHMKPYQGLAAISGPERRVHRHDFVGVDVSLVPEDEFPGYYELRERTQQLLEESALLEAEADPGARRLEIMIENLAGHALPSGATFDREMWLEVIIRDATDDVVFESGTLDDRGDLRVDDPRRTTRPGTDPQLVLYTQWLYDDPKVDDPHATAPRVPVDFLWEPNSDESRVVPPGARDRPGYDLDSLPAGRYTAEIRLLFRSFPPHLLRHLEHEAGLDPDVAARVPTMEMQRTTVSFELP